MPKALDTVAWSSNISKNSWYNIKIQSKYKLQFQNGSIAYEHDRVGKDLKQQQLYKSMQYETATASNSNYTKHRQIATTKINQISK